MSGVAVGTRACGWWVGPVWKLGGETCVCMLEADHPMPHVCSCGSWFEGCGHAPASASAAPEPGHEPE